MADLATTMGGMVPKISATGILTTFMWFFVGIAVLGCVIAWVFIIWRNKRFGEYSIEIYSKDSNGNVYRNYDRGGIFLNKKTGIKALWLEKAKKALDPNKIPYITTIIKQGKLVKTIQLIRTGVSNYRYCKVVLDDQGRLDFTVGEEDLNWATQELESVKRTYLKKSFMEQFGAMAVFVLVAIIILILLLSIFSKLSVIKDTMASVDSVTKSQMQITEYQKNITEMLTKTTPNGLAYYPQIK